MIYHVIIIGGGPAGLFAGANIRDKKILLLEKNEIPGKKLLLSGAGQCNYTNNMAISEFLKQYGSKGRFLKTALYNFTNCDVIDFFDRKGLKSIIREDGKVFPHSLKAKDVLEVLIDSVNHVEILTRTAAEKVLYDEDKKLFYVKTHSNTFASYNLIITTGGKSYPGSGSTGDCYQFARSLGHTLVEPKPALTPVYVEDYPFKELSGISFKNIKISLWKGNRKFNEFTGSFLFTHVNISGPVILNNSRYMDAGDILKINFTSLHNEEEFRVYFENLIRDSGKLSIKSALKQLNIPKRFIEKVLEIAGIDENILCSQLNKNYRKKLIQLFSSYSMKIKNLGDYHIAMVTKGGVSTDEVNSKTMESKKISGLYFAGEVLDYDGNTGGFNIQAAFSTAKLAAEAIERDIP
jgi:predicted Rossmann fold flavoprotein